MLDCNIKFDGKITTNIDNLQKALKFDTQIISTNDDIKHALSMIHHCYETMIVSNILKV